MNAHKLGAYFLLVSLVFAGNSVAAVKSELQRDGFTEVYDEAGFNGKTFMVDDQCPDVFSFPNELISFIEKYPIVTSGALVLQVSINHCIVVQYNRPTTCFSESTLSNFYQF